MVMFTPNSYGKSLREAHSKMLVISWTCMKFTVGTTVSSNKSAESWDQSWYCQYLLGYHGEYDRPIWSGLTYTVLPDRIRPHIRAYSPSDYYTSNYTHMTRIFICSDRTESKTVRTFDTQGWDITLVQWALKFQPVKQRERSNKESHNLYKFNKSLAESRTNIPKVLLPGIFFFKESLNSRFATIL